MFSMKIFYLLIANIIVCRLKENSYLSYRYTVRSTVGLLLFYDTKRFISRVLKYRLKKEIKYFFCPLQFITINIRITRIFLSSEIFSQL